MFPFAYNPSPMAAPRLLLLLHYSYQPPPLLMATVSGDGWPEVKKMIRSIHRAARRTSWTRRPSLGRIAAAAVVLLVWFSSATDKEREAISVAKKTRSGGNKGIRVVVFAGAGKLVPLVALRLLVDRCLIDLLDGPCRHCCSVPLMMSGPDGQTLPLVSVFLLVRWPPRRPSGWTRSPAHPTEDPWSLSPSMD
jgi:hypothetical protein